MALHIKSSQALQTKEGLRRVMGLELEKLGGTLPIFHTHLLDALQFYKSKSFRNSVGDSIFVF